MSKNIIVEDERTKQNTGKTCAWAIAITYVYLLVEMGYKLFSKQAGNSGWELVLLLLISLVLYVGNRNNVNGHLPRTISGRLLPTGLSHSDKKARIKSYVGGSVIFGIVMAIPFNANEIFGNMSAFPNNILSILLYFLVESVWLFIISFILDYFYGEHTVKKYNSSIHDDEE